jgi:hypothetical protein
MSFKAKGVTVQVVSELQQVAGYFQEKSSDGKSCKDQETNQADMKKTSAHFT